MSSVAPQIGIEDGIVRLVRRTSGNDEPSHVGLGLLLDDRTILTCSHVLNLCLPNRDIGEKHSPDSGSCFELSFPILDDGQIANARLKSWSPPAPYGLDCAVLTLEEVAPKNAGRAILSVIERDSVLDDPLSVYGSLENGHPGAHLRARLSGVVGSAWTHMEVEGQHGVQQGFSGGAVWDLKQRTVVGMLVARAVGSQGLTAYFLSADRIAAEFGDELPIEIRRIPLRRQRWFTGIAILLFVLMLVHFLANRSSEFAQLLPWAKGDRHLAAFFGLHFFAVILGPYVMWSALSQARSFALRPWWQRVPPAFGGQAADSLDNTKLGALAVIFFLMLLPIYAQGFFLERVLIFPSSGMSEVYVDTSRFGGAEECGQAFCRHTGAGIWSFITDGPYLDYAYQISGQDVCSDGGRCTITFFPLLQPLVLLLMSIVSFGLFFYCMYALIFSQPYRGRTRST